MPTKSGAAGTPRVVVVTGGAAGIGAAVAETLGLRGAYVVTMDPMVTVDGSTRLQTSEPTTADRIVAAGGTARASNTSVTDADAVRELFSGLVEECGSLDAVINVAGITRASGFAHGAEQDWTDVLSVHLEGYLNVLRAALPIMAEAGHGMVLGFTSGSGWRAADAGAYSCAKRAVAALTWQIGRVAPPGVSVNALSPIAATRMVTSGLSRAGAGSDPSGRSAASGGVALAMMPPPENLGPVGAYLASDDFSWASGQVMFSGGSELTWIAPPHLVEVARAADVKSLSYALETLGPAAFAPAEAAQATNGGSNPRFGAIFEEPGPGSGAAGAGTDGRRCAIVTDDAAWGEALYEALTGRGAECIGIGAWQGARRGPPDVARGFAASADQLARVSADAGSIDAVIVALAGAAGTRITSAPRSDWERVLDEHAGVAEQIRRDAGWMRAVADYSAATERPVRVVTVADATSSGGRSRAQAATQFARAAHGATENRVDAFAIGVETTEASGRDPTAELAAFLACGADVAALSGAELVVSSDWLGVRSHPNPTGTISYGGPEIPPWLDGALRGVTSGTFV